VNFGTSGHRGLLFYCLVGVPTIMDMERTKMSKSGGQASGGDDDVLTGIARAVGSALGTVAGKVSKTPKAVRPKRSKSNSSASRPGKAAGKRKAVPKRRK
jgi:hypothetical protein